MLIWIERGHLKPFEVVLFKLHTAILQKEFLKNTANGLINLNIKYLISKIGKVWTDKSREEVCNDFINNDRFYKSIVSDLVNMGISTHIPSLVHLICIYGHSLLLNKLFEMGVTINVHAADHNGNTCLHMAISNGNIELIQTLLNMDSPTFKLNNNSLSPLMMVCDKGISQIALQLINVLK
jgi:hypothetical protein